MRIKKIVALIHPDYVFKMVNSGLMSKNEAQLELNRKWEEKMEEVASSKDSIMLYFSPILDEDEANAHLINLQKENDQFIVSIFEQIRHYREILGNRLFVFWGQIKPTSEELKRLFAAQNIELDDELQLEAYGEVFEDCVDKWGNHLKKELGITDENFTMLQDMSLTDEILKELTREAVRKVS